jgi:hypothetical protein
MAPELVEENPRHQGQPDRREAGDLDGPVEQLIRRVVRRVEQGQYPD